MNIFPVELKAFPFPSPSENQGPYRSMKITKIDYVRNLSLYLLRDHLRGRAWFFATISWWPEQLNRKCVNRMCFCRKKTVTVSTSKMQFRVWPPTPLLHGTFASCCEFSKRFTWSLITVCSKRYGSARQVRPCLVFLTCVFIPPVNLIELSVSGVGIVPKIIVGLSFAVRTNYFRATQFEYVTVPNFDHILFCPFEVTSGWPCPMDFAVCEIIIMRLFIYHKALSHHKTSKRCTGDKISTGNTFYHI